MTMRYILNKCSKLYIDIDEEESRNWEEPRKLCSENHRTRGQGSSSGPGSLAGQRQREIGPRGKTEKPGSSKSQVQVFKAWFKVLKVQLMDSSQWQKVLRRFTKFKIRNDKCFALQITLFSDLYNLYAGQEESIK